MRSHADHSILPEITESAAAGHDGFGVSAFPQTIVTICRSQ